jgi:hypothetical protein
VIKDRSLRTCAFNRAPCICALIVVVVAGLASCGSSRTAAAEPKSRVIDSSSSTMAATTTSQPTTFSPTTSRTLDTTIATVAPAVSTSKMQGIVNECGIESPYVLRNQIVLVSANDVIAGFAADCIRNKVVSPAGLAVLSAATGVNGPQTVTEDGLVFTQIYNKLSDIDTLTVQPVSTGQVAAAGAAELTPFTTTTLNAATEAIGEAKIKEMIAKCKVPDIGVVDARMIGLIPTGGESAGVLAQINAAEACIKDTYLKADSIAKIAAATAQSGLVDIYQDGVLISGNPSLLTVIAAAP